MKVTSDEQNAFVASRYSSSRCLTEGTWIGLRRNPKNLSQWVWRDDFNVKPQYTKWHRKEPMNERLDKNCTEIHPSKSIYWYGRECSARGCYICVKGKLWVIMVFLRFWTVNSFLVPWSPWRSTWFFFQMPTSVTIIISVAANVVPMSLEVINVLAGQAIQRPKKNENVKVLPAHHLLLKFFEVSNLLGKGFRFLRYYWAYMWYIPFTIFIPNLPGWNSHLGKIHLYDINNNNNIMI